VILLDGAGKVRGETQFVVEILQRFIGRGRSTEYLVHCSRYRSWCKNRNFASFVWLWNVVLCKGRTQRKYISPNVIGM